MSSAVIKFMFEDSLRRFSVDRNASWSNLQDHISKVINVPASEFFVTYVDEDGDTVRIATDGEVAELLTFNPTVRLIVIRSSANFEPTSNPQTSIEPAATEPMPEPVAMEVASNNVVEPTLETSAVSEVLTSASAAGASNDQQNDLNISSISLSPASKMSEAAEDEPPAASSSKQTEEDDEAFASSAAAASSSSASATAAVDAAVTAMAIAADTAETIVRASTDVMAQLTSTWNTLVDRNPEVFDKANRLTEELFQKITVEAAVARERFVHARDTWMTRHRASFDRATTQYEQLRAELRKAREQRAHQQQPQQQPQPEKQQVQPQVQPQVQQQPIPQIPQQPVQQVQEPPSPWAEQLAKLAELGFVDIALNISLLERHQGNIVLVVNHLFTQ